jgi:ribosomal protein L20
LRGTHDSAATIVVAATGKRAGYVPRQYSAFIARLLDANVAITATAIRELAVSDDAGRWVIRATLG